MASSVTLYSSLEIKLTGLSSTYKEVRVRNVVLLRIRANETKQAFGLPHLSLTCHYTDWKILEDFILFFFIFLPLSLPLSFLTLGNKGT